MVKSFKEFVNEDVSANGFRLAARDAHQTAKNINSIFIERSGWFSRPKPIHIDELCRAYKNLCPDMEVMFPGTVNKIFHPQIIAKLGFPVDTNGMVHWQL
jgi:hypothetical protein